MRHKDKDISIGSILEQMYKRYRLDTKALESKIQKDWGEIFGTMITKHTTEITLKDKTLYIKVDNPPLKNEIYLQKHLVVGKINEFYGEVLVEKIFVSS
jgi:hypothetical protein